MHLNGLDLNLLVSLDALLNERNVTRASERLHVSQPAMSFALQKLRFHFSDPLLERIGRQMELTPRARMLVGPLKEILFDVRALLSDGDSFQPAEAQRTFKVVMSNSCAEIFGVQLVDEIVSAGPGLNCEIDELSMDTLTRLHDGQIDACVTLPHSALFDPAYRRDDVCEQLLFHDRFILAGSRSNPLLNRPISYPEFCQQVFVDVRFGGRLVSNIELALRKQMERPRIGGCVPTFFHALSMVSGTDMVTIVPHRLFEIHKDYLQLKALPAPIELLELNETAMWHPRSEADPGHRWLRDVMSAVAERMPATAEPLGMDPPVRRTLQAVGDCGTKPRAVAGGRP